MSRTYKAKTTYRWFKWYRKHRAHKLTRSESKARIDSGIAQKDDVCIIQDEIDGMISYHYPEIYKQK